MVAEANPDGLASGTRTNANGVDLNRNFPAANRVDGSGGGDSALSEPESRAIARLLEEYHPERIVALHGHLGCMDYDGPARSLAQAMSRACGLEVRRLGSQPGSLGSYAGCDLAIPVVTLELTEADGRRGALALWSRYGKALLVALEGA